jgi:hypothetical protein
MSAFEQFKQDLERNYVFKIRYKNESLLMRLIAIIVCLFNRNFMTDYITTIGNTIYFPNKEYVKNNQLSAMAVLAHEIVHVEQSEKYGRVLFSALYLFPQVLALISVFAIFAVFWLPMLWFLTFLVFLAPLPAPWRAKFEFEGYTMSLFVQDLLGKYRNYPKDVILKDLSMIAVRTDQKNFKGSFYYFMWPFGMEKDFEKKINDISDGVIVDTGKLYGRVSRAYLNAVSTYGL